MKYVDKLIDNVKLQEKLVNCNQDLANGEDFVTVIKRYQIYQGMPLSMIQIGFKTGQIDEIMTMLANHFQDEVSEAIGRFLNIIEPSIVAFLSLIVGVVLISVMLPLISIMASI
ncbi:type II secretion system F family protein [Coprobacillaceae bacterium CR2/5/TPMF4]|nr:type II secretion system F family protein [Coprobacillaceae bacterium CR2/5/TPMF4]